MCSVAIVTTLLAFSVGVQGIDPHSFQLPPGIAKLLEGTYGLEKTPPSGVSQLSVAIVDGNLRLKMGAADNRMVPAGVAKQTSGAATSDVYRFTVANRPGVTLGFTVTNGVVDYMFYDEASTEPHFITSGRRSTGLIVAPRRNRNMFDLPLDILGLFNGTYVLEKATPAGVTEVTVELLGGDLRFRMGDDDERLLTENRGIETNADRTRSDVYTFVVANKPGVSVRFTVAKGEVTSMFYDEAVSGKPKFITSAKRKPRS